MSTQPRILVLSNAMEDGRVSPCCMEPMEHEYDQREGDWWVCTKCKKKQEERSHLFLLTDYKPFPLSR